MAILTSVRGRVELDPMRIPQAREAEPSFGDTFAAALEQAVAIDPPAPVDSNDPLAPTEQAVAATTAEAEPTAPAEPEPAASTEGTEAPAETSEPLAHADGVDANDVARANVATTTHAATTPASDAPGPAVAERTEPLLAAVAQRRSPAAGTALGSPGTAGQPATASDRGTPPARGIGGGGDRPRAPLATPAAAATYRSATMASAEMLEQARDSVFKQILMQLTPTGGEMRLRLQPPELGELDLQLLVENGNQLQLRIGAERADLAELLRANLDQLKATLRQAGIEVGEASVHTRDSSSREQPRDRGAAAGRDRSPTPMPSPRRIHRGSGLDFWA